MLLSIVIPHYNLPRELLERCIDSIIKQGIATDDYEIIVVDDGSHEPPVWIESLHPGTNIHLVTATHGGPGAARNHGIEKARGTYIEFVDADDTIIPGNSYSQCLDKLRSEMPEILHFRYRIVTGTGIPNAKAKKRVTFSNTISGATFMKEFNLPGSPCRYFFRRSLALEKNIRFPENIFHEDEEFNTILHFHARTLVYSNATLYNYCIRKGSTTANSSQEFETKRIDDMLHIIGRLVHFRCTVQSCSKLQEKAFAHKLTMLTVDAIRNMLYNGMEATTIHNRCLGQLAPLGLYPLPRASYSAKYRIFRTLANSRCGMRVLRAIQPSHKPTKR